MYIKSSVQLHDQNQDWNLLDYAMTKKSEANAVHLCDSTWDNKHTKATAFEVNSISKWQLMKLLETEIMRTSLGTCNVVYIHGHTLRSRQRLQDLDQYLRSVLR